MPQGIYRLLTANLGTEMIYSFVIILCSLIIYFSTKEIQDLSSHKGVKYFRHSFLFIAIAFLFRSFIKFLLVYFGINNIIFFSPRLIGVLTIGFFIYAGTIATLYLVYSLLWEKHKWISNKIYLLHLSSMLIAILTVLFINAPLLLLVSFILFILGIFASIEGYKKSKNKKKSKNLTIIYILIFAFWMLNIVEVITPNFLYGTQFIIYLISISLFLTVLYKVTKKVGTN